MKTVINIVRVILGSALSIIAYLLLVIVVPYVFYYIWIFLRTMAQFFSKYDTTPFFSFEYDIQDLITYIMSVCLGTVVTGVLSGIVGGVIAPAINRIGMISGIMWFVFTIFLLDIAIDRWDSEHWVYSLCMEIAFALTSVLYLAAVACTLGFRCDNKNE